MDQFYFWVRPQRITYVKRRCICLHLHTPRESEGEEERGSYWCIADKLQIPSLSLLICNPPSTVDALFLALPLYMTSLPPDRPLTSPHAAIYNLSHPAYLTTWSFYPYTSHPSISGHNSAWPLRNAAVWGFKLGYKVELFHKAVMTQPVMSLYFWRIWLLVWFYSKCGTPKPLLSRCIKVNVFYVKQIFWPQNKTIKLCVPQC